MLVVVADEGTLLSAIPDQVVAVLVKVTRLHLLPEPIPLAVEVVEVITLGPLPQGEKAVVQAS